MEPNSPFDEFVQPSLDQEAIIHLQNAAKWTQFLSILGFIYLGINALSALGLLFGMDSSGLDAIMPIPISMIAVVILLFTGLVFLPIYYQFSFSRNVKLAFKTGQPGALTEAFRYLNAHYRFFGILAIIMLALYGLMMIGMIGFIAMAGSGAPM